MEIREWQRLTTKCVLLLGAVFLIGMCCDLERNGKPSATVHADNQTGEFSESALEQSVERIEVVYSKKSYIESLSNKYIRIPKPESATGAAVYLENQYMEASICLRMEGVNKKEYSEKQIERINKDQIYRGKINAYQENDMAEKISIQNIADQQTQKRCLEIRIELNRVYEPELYDTGSAYYVILQNPRDVYRQILVVDAGHGGMDEGTYSRDEKYKEKEYALRVVKAVKELLDDSEIKVYYTRLSDRDVSKRDRVWLANQVQADLFISIHCNASDYGDTTAYGMEGLYSGKKQASNEYLTSKKATSILIRELTAYTGKRNRGIICRNALYLMNHSKVPVSIIEIGYMSNRSDLRYIVREKNQKEIAEGLVQGIERTLEYAEAQKNTEEGEGE